MVKLTKTLIVFTALAALTLLSACVVRAGVHAHAEPNLVEVSPGVWVVEDYHEPIFYSNGYYWRSDGGVWYRSTYYTGGFARVRYAPPRAIVTIRNPRGYVRYRARSGVRVRQGPRGTVTRYNGRAAPARRDHRRAAPARRDHRRAAPARRDHRAAPASRDHRGNSGWGRTRGDNRRAAPAKKDRRKHDKRDDDRKKRKRRNR